MSLSSASAADIPCKAAKLIVPWAPGGGAYFIFSDGTAQRVTALLADTRDRSKAKQALSDMQAVNIRIEAQAGN